VVRRTWAESAFNAGNTLTAAALASLIGAIGTIDQVSDVAQDFRAAAAALAYLVVNLGLAVVPAALHSGRRYLTLVAQATSATWPASLTLGACAVTISVLAVEAPIAAPLPLIVLPMIYRMNRAIEAQARANEQLAGVLAAQRRFLTDVSHQVATPLATIMTNLSILRRANRGKPAEEAVDDSVAEAVANLVDNAVRVSPPGEKVTLRVDRGSAGPMITVADRGPGIDEERLPRLFERFQRSDSGSGLGLAIARRVVERHGGTIRVQTAPGAGSTFTIELPA